jgi:hypothetical protein
LRSSFAARGVLFQAQDGHRAGAVLGQIGRLALGGDGFDCGQPVARIGYRADLNHRAPSFKLTPLRYHNSVSFLSQAYRFLILY